ncbi:MAG: recombinase family protein [Chloroflexi bacterium]|nr:recombinase family protein [Chloroflexota bacterium]
MTENRYLHLLRQDCPLPPGTSVVLYTRDSGGEEQDRSVAQQIEAAEEYCRHHGLVLERVYCDEAEKATAVERRDQFAEMMAELRQRFSLIYDPDKREKRTRSKPYGVLCWKSNRLGRDLLHTRHVKSDLRLRGITIISLMPIVETGNAGLDAIIETFYEYQDQQLLEEISDNARRGLAQLVTLRDTDPDFLQHNPDWPSTGAYLGIMPGGVPVGFRAERIRVGTYKRKRGKQSGEPRVVQRIVPDPETWERCRLAWEMRRGGASIRDIMLATRLYRTASSYASFFENLIYTGTLEYGGQRIADFVPALIPMAWWEAEQQQRTERSKKMRGEQLDGKLEPRRVGARHLLSGILYCGHNEGEEHPMLADAIPAKKGQHGRWDFYICSRKKNSRSQKCSSKRIGARILEQSVTQALFEHVLTRENLRQLADTIAQQLSDTNHDASVRLAAVQAELQQVERQIDNLLSAIEEMGLSPSLREKLTKREAERERLKTQADQLHRLVVKAADIPRITNAMIDEWIESIRVALQSDDLEAARSALRHFVSKVVVKDGEGTIYYTFPVELAEPARRGLGKGEVDLTVLQSNIILPHPRMRNSSIASRFHN